MKMASEVYRILEKKIIDAQQVKGPLLVSDKGAFAPNLEDDRDALTLLNASVKDAGYEAEIKIALDMAASAFYKEGSVISLEVAAFVIDNSVLNFIICIRRKI